MCPAGTWTLDPGGQTCSRPDSPVPGGSPDDPRTCPETRRPVVIGSGNKQQTETDVTSGSSGSGQSDLSFTRFYNSQIIRSGVVLSSRWTHSYSRWIQTQGTTEAYLFRPDGAMRKATLVDASVVGGRQRWQLPPLHTEQLLRTFDAANQPTGWVLTDTRDRSIETYDTTGRLAGC